jgi:predicted phosphodiesterase
MSIQNRLRELANAGSTVSQSNKVPQGWESGVRYEPDGTSVITTGPMPEINDDDYQVLIESIAGKIPDGFRVRLAEARFDPAAWHRDNNDDKAVTRPIVRYRFVIEPAPRKVAVDDLLRAIGGRRAAKTKRLKKHAGTYAVAAGDLQLGKPDGDGSEGTVNRFLDAHSRSIDRYLLLRDKGTVNDVLLLWAGDCIEGTESQGSRLLARLDLTITEQVRVYRRLLLEQVRAFADIANKVTVAVVPGNHDEAKRIGDQMATRYDDSWAIEGASQVADVMKAAGYKNIDWVFPGYDELDICLDISGTKIGLLHGHQTKGKMESWLGGAAVQRRAIGTSDVIVSGHFHHLKIQQLGPTTHVQLPALDGGSLWWRHMGRLDAPPGMITFVIDNGWRGLEIL